MLPLKRVTVATSTGSTVSNKLLQYFVPSLFSRAFQMSDNHLSDEESAVPVVAFSRKRRGWEGEHLELERKIDATAVDETASSHAAVDLEQFRNTQVGKGYQAKHVIRQPSAPDRQVTIQDMTQLHQLPKTSGEATKSRRLDDEKPTKDDSASARTRLHRYLQCEGLRKFRTELESIESST